MKHPGPGRASAWCFEFRRPTLPFGGLASFLMMGAVLMLVSPGPSSGVGGLAAGTADARIPFATSWNGENCTNPELASIIISPANTSVKGLATQVFAATALSSCGSNLTPQATFSWALSASDLGSLNSTSGPSVVYTACLAPMGGSVRVTGTYAERTLTAQAAIDVWHPTGSNDSLGSPIDGPSPESPWVRIAALSASPALAGAGVVVFLWGQKSRRPPKKAPSEAPQPSAAANQSARDDARDQRPRGPS